MDFNLSPAQKALHKSYDALCREVVATGAAAADMGIVTGQELAASLAETGALARFLDHGDTPHQHEVICGESLARTCASHFHIAATAALALFGLKRVDGSEARCEAISNGQQLVSFAYLEDGPLREPLHCATTLEQQGDGFALNGVKRFVTLGAAASAFLVVARNGDHHDVVLVDADLKGVTVEPHASTSGARGAARATVRFDSVEVPAERILKDSKGDGDSIVAQLQHQATFLDAVYLLGKAEALKAVTIAFTQSHKNNGKPLSKSQHAQFPLADVQVNTDMGRVLLGKAAWLHDNDEPARQALYTARVLLGEAAELAAKVALDVIGPFSEDDASPADRHARDVRALPFGTWDYATVCEAMAEDLLEQVENGRTCSY